MDQTTKFNIIAIPSSDADPDAYVATRFARAPFYAIYHHASLEFTFVKNRSLNGSGHTGVEAANLLVNLDVDAVLVPDIGAKAFRVLHSKDVPIHRYTKEYSVRDALYEFYERKLGQIAHHTDPHTID